MLNLPEAFEILVRMYSAAVLDHFKNPRNAGEVAGATAAVEVTNPVCGDVLRLSARVENGRVTEARFKAQGCVTAIACSSWLAEWMQGKKLEELRQLNAQPVGLRRFGSSAGSGRLSAALLLHRLPERLGVVQIQHDAFLARGNLQHFGVVRPDDCTGSHIERRGEQFREQPARENHRVPALALMRGQNDGGLGRVERVNQFPYQFGGDEWMVDQ
jgi:nitrogen fixation NifU-like protein